MELVRAVEDVILRTEESVCVFAPLVERLRELWKRNALCSDCLLSLDVPRGVEAVAAVATCVSLRVPFVFRPPNMEHEVFGATHSFRNNVICETGVPSTKRDEICYSIRTSGSTGVAKIVDVPIQCITANIHDFIRRFSITSNDRILLSTSFFFDPSMVEMLLSFATGAELVLVPDEIRALPGQLANTIRQTRPTVVQLTPTVLSRFDSRTLEWILGPASPVRILLIGGEKFPLELVKKYRSIDSLIRVFDVYGITEVSCWASVFEVNLDCDRVVLGDCIDGTNFIVRDDVLFLGGSRRCYIDGQLTLDAVSTGDVVSRTDDGQLVVVGRVDDQVKVNGIRVNLSQLSSSLVRDISTIKAADFLLFDDSMFVLFVQSAEKHDELEKSILHCMPPLLRPAAIIIRPALPCNNNGKLDRLALRKLLAEMLNDSASWVNRILSRYGIAANSSLDVTFQSLGFTSQSAAELALALGSSALVSEILAPQTTIEDIFKKRRFLSIRPQIDTKAVTVIDRSQLIIEWAFDTKKCIDGSPLIASLPSGIDVTVFASHSGCVAAVEVNSGRVVWQMHLPCRFEASTALCDEHVVIGGYNGILYWLRLVDGRVDWSFEPKEKAEIKCACTVRKGAVYFVTYAKRCFKLSFKKVEWTRGISGGSPSSIEFSMDEQIIFVTTISGVIHAFHAETGDELWSHRGLSPIFSSAYCIDDDVLAVSVTGQLVRLKQNDGTCVASVNLKTAVFSGLSQHCDSLLLASRDGLLFELSRQLEVVRSVRVRNASFVKPPITVDGELFVIGTEGFLYKIHLSGAPSERVRLSSGEVFSQVAFVESNARRTMIVTSRDNFCRCFRLPPVLDNS